MSYPKKRGSGDFHRARPKANCSHFDRLLGSHRDLSEQFFELTQQLCKKFEISKGVLVLRQEQPRRLTAISTWKHGLERDGLAINLPNDSSLFEKVAEQGQVYTENFCESFVGNFFERKLLLDDTSRSFVLQPLKANGHVVGLVGYSSENPTAFTVLEEGVLEQEASAFAALIEVRMYPPKNGSAT
ncbi:MAG: GAF domain-containing protein [Candidatus Zixiibacteriota bacterium]